MIRNVSLVNGQTDRLALPYKQDVSTIVSFAVVFWRAYLLWSRRLVVLVLHTSL
jgi:hypothetical protein